MQNKISQQINEIKKANDEYVSRLVDFYGSPENDTPVMVLDKPIPTFTFGSTIEINKIKKNDDGSILYVDKDNHDHVYTEFPIECSLKIAYELSVQKGIGDMFNDLFGE